MLLLFATLEQGQPSSEVPHFGSHSGVHFVSESLQKYTPNVVQKKAPKKSSKLVFFRHLLGPAWGANCRVLNVQMVCHGTLMSHLAAKAFKSTDFERSWHSWGTSRACNCHRFLRLGSASSGPNAIVHFTLMHPKSCSKWPPSAFSWG